MNFYINRDRTNQKTEKNESDMKDVCVCVWSDARIKLVGDEMQRRGRGRGSRHLHSFVSNGR